MRHEDVERGDELSHGDALVGLPLLEGLNIVEEDKEVVRLALVVDLGLLGAPASHDDRVLVVEKCDRCVVFVVESVLSEEVRSKRAGF